MAVPDLPDPGRSPRWRRGGRRRAHRSDPARRGAWARHSSGCAASRPVPRHRCTHLEVFAGGRVANERRQRLGLELVDQSGEGLLEMRMGGVAGGFRRAGLEEVVEAVACVLPVFGDGVGRRQDQIEDDAADALRVVAHERLRQVGAIGSPVDIPHGKAEHLAEVGEIGGALGRIVGAEVGAGGGEFAVAGFVAAKWARLVASE